MHNFLHGEDCGCNECSAALERPKAVQCSDGLDDALVCLKNISKEYQRFCDVMLTMPERRNELKAGSRFMDGLENLRDELLKRKSSNDQAQRRRDAGLELQPEREPAVR